MLQVKELTPEEQQLIRSHRIRKAMQNEIDKARMDGRRPTQSQFHERVAKAGFGDAELKERPFRLEPRIDLCRGMPDHIPEDYEARITEHAVGLVKALIATARWEIAYSKLPPVPGNK
jgi:hypothetical protein